MIKKLFSLGLLLLFSISFVACNETVSTTISTTLTSLTTEDIAIDLVVNSVILIEGDRHEIEFSTNDASGLYFSSNDTDVLTVDASGEITALSEGTATVTIESVTDDSVFAELVVTVRKRITLVSENDQITLTEGDVFQVGVVSNDEVTFSSDDTEIFVVDGDGIITAKKEGTANLIISSDYDESMEITVPVTVNKFIWVLVENDEHAMLIGDTYIFALSSNTTVSVISSNPEIVFIDEDNLIWAVSAGEATVRVISDENPDIFAEIQILVFENTESIEIVGNPFINLSSSSELSIVIFPEGSYGEVLWASLNSEIISIDEDGVITANAVGTTSIIATSLFDDSIVDVINIEVVNVVFVDQEALSGDEVDYLGFTVEYDQGLFPTIQEAIDYAPAGAQIFVSGGNYAETLTISTEGIHLIGDTSTIEGVVTVNADNVSINGFEFVGASSIINSTVISNFTFSNNQVRNITVGGAGFLSFLSIRGMIVEENGFENLTCPAISVVDFLGGLFLIQNNSIHTATTAIIFEAVNEYELLTEINVIRNTIDDVENAFRFQMLYGDQQKAIEAYARFNAVTNVSQKYVIASIDNHIEFTLNYWGAVEPDLLKFENVDPLMLRAYYSAAEDIISEADYDPELPVVIEITNTIDEIVIGELYTFTFITYPLDLITNKLKWITSNPDVLRVSKYGDITPITSGEATITLRSSVDLSISVSVTIQVTTTPGIELSVSVLTSDVLVGDSFTITATPFPVTISSALVDFTSDNELVATIDSSGLVQTHSSGIAVLTASLVDNPLITTTFTVQVYDSLDEFNLLDLLTMNQVQFSTPHEYTVFGTGFNYVDYKYESVSRYYFGEIPVNTSKIVPVFYAIRPGEPFATLPAGVDGFNETNLFWVVIHDTANTDPGGTALSHANYLYNSTLSLAELWVSWHFTIDDTYIYESLPEDERGFHAGDGSVLPYQGSTYLGGGNRNGIGIEMAINQGGDLYRTWQRTAKLVADIMVRYNLPRDHMKYHNDFSGKDCPKSLRNAGLIPLFELFEDIEYLVRSEYSDALITFESHNLEYLDQTGRIIKMPERAMTVSYTITVTDDGITESRTFYTYLPGTVH